MVIVFLPLVVCIVGLLMYALSANPKLVEIGRLMFLAGLLALLFQGPEVMHIIP